MEDGMSIRSTVLICAVAVFAAATVKADVDLFKLGTPGKTAVKSWSCDKKIKISSQEKYDGVNSFEAAMPNSWCFGKKIVPVDPAKKCRLSGWVKAVGKNNGKIYFGLVLYDAKKRVIGRSNVNALPGTETKLLSDAKKGDISIKVAYCKQWKKFNNYLKKTVC